jgi:hypothetical protein
VVKKDRPIPVFTAEHAESRSIATIPRKKLHRVDDNIAMVYLFRLQIDFPTMKTSWPFVLAFALIFYANGAAFVESFVNYPSWRLVGANEFIRYHQFISPRVVAFLVVPALSATVLTAVMLKFRPAAIPLWSVWTALGLQIIVWVSSAAIQIPMQVEFSSKGFSEETLAKLLISNFWLRRIPLAAAAALFVWMTHKVLSMPQKNEASPTSQKDYERKTLATTS